MISIDLITGFLGSGKTTFIRNYVKYLVNKGEKVCILEQDYGAINVDVMMLSDLRGESCEIEMIAGACDLDCHIRRFKTKLIQMAMSGYTKVLVEPSGVFDTEEFFDLMNEKPISNWYTIGSVISIVDYNIKINSDESMYLFGNQISSAGIIVISKINGNKEFSPILNNAMEHIKCPRVFKENEILKIPFDKIDYSIIENSSYQEYPYEKRHVIEDNGYSTVYFMNLESSPFEIKENAKIILNDKSYGDVIRIKGFYKDHENWYKINYTKNEFEEEKILDGQSVIIVIGENLNKKKIQELFKMDILNM